MKLLAKVVVLKYPCHKCGGFQQFTLVEAEVLDGDLLRSGAGAKAAVDGVPLDGAKADLRGSWRWICEGLTARQGSQLHKTTTFAARFAENHQVANPL